MVFQCVCLIECFLAEIALKVLEKIAFLSAALATNFTSTLPLSAVDMYVSVGEAQTLEYFEAEVTMEGPRLV